jgi:hypothetical protein
MGGVLSWLSGAQGAAGNAGQYYTNAENQLVNAYGSPAAQLFGKEQLAAEQPGFQSALQSGIGAEAAAGLLGSGQGQQSLNQVISNQGATQAAALAPLYQQALSQYGNIVAQQPGAQLGAYNNAINSTIQGIGDIGSFFGLGVPGLGGSSSSSVPGATGDSNVTLGNLPSNPYG